MINALTVDVEEWYHTNGLNIPQINWGNYPSRVKENTIRLLDLFDMNQVKATFFILGCVAKDHPDLVREIYNRGHEIGSHGFNHQLVSRQSLNEFTNDFVKSKSILEDIIGTKVCYYRAPSWSISKERLEEVLLILEEHGIICDSSLQPFQTPLSGIRGIPSQPFIPVLNGRILNLIEYPPTVCHFLNLFKVPYAGGFYLRFFPYWFIKNSLKKLNTKREGMVYIHPWEIDPKIPRLATGSHIQFIQYYHLEKTMGKLEKLLKEFHFSNLGEVIKGKNYPKKGLDQI